MTQDKKNYLELQDLFKFPTKAFKLIGFDIFNDENIFTISSRQQKVKKVFKNIYFGICMLICFIFLIMFIVWAIQKSNEPLPFLSGLLNISNHTFAFNRLVYICFNRRKLNDFLRMLNNLFPTSTVEQQKYDIEKYRRMLTKRQKIYATFCVMPGCLGAIGHITNYIQNGTKTFIIDIWLPFGHSTTFTYFASSIFINFASSVFLIAFFVGDWVPYTLITVLAMKNDILGKKLKQQLKNVEIELKDLKEVINNQNQLIEATNFLESILRRLFLSNFIVSSFTICLVGFQLILSKDTVSVMLYLSVLCVVMMETLLLCQHGQKLIDSSAKVSHMIYTSKWYEIKNGKVKKMLPVMMQLAQQEKYLTGCGFVDICNETFCDIFSTGYSYLGILRTLYNK
ncbi:hypothetical protein PVAND_005154 [Polypedilum vanderplanki]|uniref:Odorant receptor n=1 Tax=Polypedilum vanderplanki TaxID=319348 RepID=A0A9J6BZ23_POLVA|nr:hypothetical protein PVAND_005154 [Polypedilum vanderplanki]